MRISDWSSAVCSSDRVEAETVAYGGCRDRDDEGRHHVLRRHLPRQRPRERSAQQSKDCRRSLLREAYGSGIAAGQGGDDEHYHRPEQDDADRGEDVFLTRAGKGEPGDADTRSEERRGGKGGVRKGRTRG